MANAKLAKVSTLPSAASYRHTQVSREDAEYGVINLADEPRLKLLAGCIAEQHLAGFGKVLDLRQVPCPLCRAPGFNTGWGYFLHTCGTEVCGEDIADKCSADRERAS